MAFSAAIDRTVLYIDDALLTKAVLGQGLGVASANHLFGRRRVFSIDCKTLMSRLKNRRGSPRL